MRMSDLLEHKHNSSIEINKTQDRLLGELEWRKLRLAETYTRGLKAAKKLENVERTFKEFKRGDADLGDLISALNDL